MMPGRIQMEKRNIQRVRNPSERMPIAFVIRSRNTADRLPVQAGLNMRIVNDVTRVVVIDKTVVESGEIHRDRGENQQQAKDGVAQCSPRGSRGWWLRLRRHEIIRCIVA